MYFKFDKIVKFRENNIFYLTIQTGFNSLAHVRIDLQNQFDRKSRTMDKSTSTIKI